MMHHLESLFTTLALTFALVLALSAVAFAQETTGTVTGNVVDQNGAAVSGAQVTLTDPTRGFSQSYQTSDDGTFTATSLPASTYTLSVEMAGFKKHVQDKFVLNVNDRSTLNIVLEPGQVSEVVNVASETTLIQDSPTQRGLISGDQIRELPLNTRNFVQLALLSAGVSSSNPSQIGSGALSVVQLSINGGRTSSINWLVDGARNVDTGSNLTLLTTPSIDAIQEFTVLTSNYAPEFGRNGGGVINVVTRSGSNDFHGTLYEFLRNDALNARPPFQTVPLAGINTASGEPRFEAPLRYNDYGFTIGGPIYFPRFGEGGPVVYNGRNKSFFFFSQEWKKTRTVNTAVGTVPTLLERSGSFAGNVIDPLTGVAFPVVGGRSIIPVSRFDPNAVAILQFIPPPNEVTPGSTNLNRFRRAVGLSSDISQSIVRLDHNFSSAWSIYGRYIHETFARNDPGGNPFLDPFARDATAGTLYPFVAAQNTVTPGKNFVVTLKTILSPTMINEASFDYAYNAIVTTFAGTGLRANAPGFTSPELFPSTLQGALPSITFTGTTANFSFVSPQSIDNPSYTFRDTLTIAKGRHTIKLGGFFSREAKNENAGNALHGSYAFGAGSRSGNQLADFFLGTPTTYIEDQNEVKVQLRYNTLEFFGQDSWKITPRLTLDYGARYSLYSNPIEVSNFLTAFRPDFYDPARAVRVDPVSGNVITGSGDRFNGIIFAGANSPYGRRVQSNQYNTLGPRVGLAYNFGGGRTVLRGGFGVYYDRTLVGIVEQNAFVNPLISSRVTIDNPLLSNPGAGVARTTLPVISLSSTGDPFKVPRTMQYSFSIQREVFKNAVLELAYVGTNGRNLLHQVNINQPLPGAQAALTTALRASGVLTLTSNPVSVNAVRPFLGYGAINDRRTEASSDYNSMQVTFNKRMSQGLQYGVVYTWSKNLTDASTDRTDVPQDVLRLDLERAPSQFDRTHIFTTHVVYELPFFRRSTGLKRTLLGGFQVTGVYTAQSGTPLTITQTIDVARPANSPFAFSDPLGTSSTLRPNLIGDPHGTGSLTRWFNTSAFAPAFFNYGSAGRGLVRGPGIDNWDMAVFKNFRFSEATNLQLRLEMFNVFNHPQYLNPGTAARFVIDPDAPAGTFPTRYVQNEPTFGVITGTRDPRNIQLGVKFNF
jgi:outer membrane receptor protein involved in Fe transport